MSQEQSKIHELILKNRTYRRFYEDEAIELSTLENLIDLARLSSSGGNMQALKYIISSDKARNAEVFENLKWAGYLQDWDGPEEGERPAAYIVVLGDREISKNYFWDHGIASQSILLGATEIGLGGCMFGSFDKSGLRMDLAIPEQYEILLVIALGKPKEKVVLEEIKPDGDVKYWRDENAVHHVPKRRLEDIILKL
ncbi:MAG: nitroreductase family protein [Clostridiales bacterium]|nr:nitroreductase family protein [Clostridiales bacterium]